MFAHEFMRNALIAGSFVGLACGLVGSLRGSPRPGLRRRCLSHVAFTGGLAAAVLGLNILAGVFAATILGGIVMGLLGDKARADDVTIGSLFAWTLGLGVLFLTIFTTQDSAGNGTAGVRVLFGSIFGLSGSDVRTSVVLAVLASAVLLAIARPLLFASLDSAVAAAQGVPVRVLGLGFLALLGLVAAQATQAVGALLCSACWPPRRRRAQADCESLPRPAPLRPLFRRLDLGRAHAELRLPDPAAELDDHRRGRRDLPGCVRHDDPARSSRLAGPGKR